MSLADKLCLGCWMVLVEGLSIAFLRVHYLTKYPRILAPLKWHNKFTKRERGFLYLCAPGVLVAYGMDLFFFRGQFSAKLYDLLERRYCNR